MTFIRYIYFSLFFFTALLSNKSFAQYYSTGQDPALANWKQINTENFQIIFQEEFEEKAKQIASTLEYYYIKAGNTLEHSPKKISVIVHNQTILSNGYVAWAPKRMELSVTPPQDAYPDPWLEHLCVHELRHVVQLDKLNQGITKILSIVFGQHATGLIAGQLPLWYYEGDAVCTETAFSEFGRGRLPYFEQGIKTHLLSDDKRFSLDQSLFGSYKQQIPNHYEFGYQLTAYTRSRYGEDIWSEVENHVARNSYTLLPTPFSFFRGLKKNIGLSQKELYEETMGFLDSSWSAKSEIKEFNKPNFFQGYQIKEYEDYINPLSIDEDYMIALKKGLSHIPQFVLMGTNSEKVLHEPGYLVSNDFSYANNILVWAEYKPDTRWQNREYTTIKVLNIKTKREYELIKKSRYFSPDFTNLADKIAIVEVDKTNQSFLVILNAFNGVELERIELKEGFIIRPQWSDDEKYIYAIILTDSGKQVSRYSFETKTWEIVFKPDHADIQRILPKEHYIFYHSTYNGTDNIYVFDQKSKEIYQISDSKFGISEFDYVANKNELIVNEYTSQGFRLATIPVERAKWEKINQEKPYRFELADILANQEQVERFDIQKSSESIVVKPFRKYLNLFNFHSWLPFYVDYDHMDLGNAFADPSEVYNNVHPGVTLLSQNKLSTVDAILGYAYKDGNHFISSTLTFKGQYPVFKISADYGTQQLISTTSSATWYPQTNTGYNYSIDLYVPFNFTKGKFIKGFRPSLSVDYSDNYYFNYQNNYYIKGLEILKSELLLYSYQLKAERDIIPKLGAIFDFKLYNTPFESELYGYLYNAEALFYLPGYGSSGFKVELGYQYQDPVLYLFSSSFSFPRGIQTTRTEKMTKFYGDYIFPIAYPDWNLGSALYIKRIRGAGFIDYAFNSYRTLNQAQTNIFWAKENNLSFGVELTADYHLLRTIFPLNTGVRLGYTPTESKLIFEMIFGIDLYSL